MAFKSPGISASAPAQDQEDRVLASFHPDIAKQMEKTVEDTISGITRSRSFFRIQNIVDKINHNAEKNYPEEVIENPQFDELINYFIARRPLVEIGNTGNVTTPEMVELEKKMIMHAGMRTKDHILPDAVVRAAIASKKGISQEQSEAVEAACLSDKRVTVIEGAAGAGKSFTMEAVKESYAAEGYKVMGAALSWNAAQVLSSSIKLDGCLAIEILVRNLREARAAGTDFFRCPTVLIIDEAGMVGTEHIATILEETAMSTHKVKVVLTGDSLQVNPVDAGNTLQTIVAIHGGSRIDTIRRQKQDSHRKAVKNFSHRESGKAMYPFLHQEAIHWAPDKDVLFNMVVQDFISYRHHYKDAERPKTALVLAHSNRDVIDLNARIRAVYKRLGIVDPREVSMEVTDGREKWTAGFSVGDEVVVRATGKNIIVYDIDPNAPQDDETTWTPIRKGIYNRNAGKVVAIRRSKKPLGSYDFVVDLEGDSPGRVVINSKAYIHKNGGLPMVHNFATTIYGSQGQTVDKVFLLDSAMMEFRLAYVGMSRHREHVEVYLDETDLHNRMDKMLGLKSPLKVKDKDKEYGKPDQTLLVELGRYRRPEMLQVVAKSWGKKSENLTAMMYEIMRKQEKAEDPKIEAKRPIIRADLNEEQEMIDFIPELNQDIPKVDIETIMLLPEPVAEAELVRKTEVNIRNDQWRSQEVPLRQQLDPTVPEEMPTRGQPGLFKRAMNIFKGQNGPDQQGPAPVVRPQSARLEDATSAFGNQGPQNRAAFQQQSWVSRKLLGPKIVVPMVPTVVPCGQVLEGKVSFEGVPRTASDENTPTISEEFLQKTENVYWATGRNKEPRILARDETGSIQARYRFDGTCRVGEGYPPMILNSNPGTDTPIYIVPGAYEFLLISDTLQKKYKDTPEKIPHFIWAAKDMDWGLIAEELKGQKLFIIRSKKDASQLDWAQSLEDILYNRFGLAAQIYPPSAPMPNQQGAAPAAQKTSASRPTF